MKTFSNILIICFIISHITFAADTNQCEWGPEAGKCQLSIRMKHGGTEIKANQPVDLILRIRNLSTNETLEIWINGRFELPEVVSAEVWSPSRKQLFSGIPHVRRGSSTFHYIRPQETYEYSLPLGQLSEYQSNGVYKVIVKRKGLHGETAISNPLELKVVPGEWKEPEPALRFP